ncbi:hypothetical protein MCHI_002949, partial [Candidatus Magnetoovum chiemensis]
MLNSINYKFKNNDVVVLGITVDSDANRIDVEKYSKSFSINYQILFSDSLTEKLYGIR